MRRGPREAPVEHHRTTELSGNNVTSGAGLDSEISVYIGEEVVRPLRPITKVTAERSRSSVIRSDNLRNMRPSVLSIEVCIHEFDQCDAIPPLVSVDGRRERSKLS
jgi:hypothetical protein